MNDHLLNYDKEIDEVVLTEQANAFSCFKLLHDADSTKKKLTYKAQLKVLFFLYDIRSVLNERYTPAQRLEIIYRDIVPYGKDRIITPEFIACEKTILRHTYSREEAQFHQIQADFDNFLDHLNKIPWEREVSEIITEGKKRTERSWMKSNMEERMRAVKSAKDLLTLQKELETIVKGQRRSAEQSSVTVRMFEDPDILKTIRVKDG